MTYITRAVEAVEHRLKVLPEDAADALQEAWPFLQAHFREEMPPTYSRIKEYLYSSTILTEPEAAAVARDLQHYISENHKQHIRGLEATLTQRNQTIRQLIERIDDLEEADGHRDGLNEDNERDKDMYRQGWSDGLVKAYTSTFNEYERAYEERYG